MFGTTNARRLLGLTVFVLAWLVVTSAVMAAGGPPPKPACETNGPLTISGFSPSSYSYVQTASGSVTGSFAVTSPSLRINGNCNSSLPYVFGNGNSGADIDVSVTISGVTDAETALPVDALTLAQIKSLFSFVPANFTLTNPGTGSQSVGFTFTHSTLILPGTYDVSIAVTPETGVGVGAPAALTFVLTVSAPVAVDTLPPTVEITSPTDNAGYILNAALPVRFTAVDPVEGGAGTGVQSLAASIASAGGAWTSAISPLGVTPPLSVAAGITVDASADLLATPIGSFTLTAQATDGASHTGQDQVSFTVKARVLFLPPLSVPGRQFKVGSTLPIKWTFTDADGHFLPPFGSVLLQVRDASSVVWQAVAGEGAENIRWETDLSGNAVQYINNFPIPATGTYWVDVYVNDVDDTPALQGSFSFQSSTKGGK